MRVEVAYVGREGTALVEVDVPCGASVAQAVAISGLVARFELFEAALSYAIHGQRARTDTPLRDGDRVELLRPLVVDPKTARRDRARIHRNQRSRNRRSGA
ncbi:MAG TPA: RnfH family protein [Casimicrobiaceae bacterium]|nr:RnfH family protein [Casimicrobiaceae bacterium]